MRDQSLQFIDREMAKYLDEMLKEFEQGESTPEILLDELKKALPIRKMDSSSRKARVAGFHIVSENLFQLVFDAGQAVLGDDWTRERVTTEARLLPFSHYHWLSGSREPVANIQTRSDYMNDPRTALQKLEDDILSLAKLLRNKFSTEVQNEAS